MLSGTACRVLLGAGLARIAGLSVGNWTRKEEEEVLKMTFSNGDVAVYLSKI